jgi:hypothetical protein
MKEREPIFIQQVGNGYIVEPSICHPDTARGMTAEDRLVFNHITDLTDWIIKHFQRESVPKDAVQRNEKDTLKVTGIKNCARCGHNHPEIEFFRLSRQEDDGCTHWAPCPHNSQPIMLKIIKDR